MSLPTRPPPPLAAASPRLRQPIFHSTVLGCGLFLLCLFGILTRPGYELASFWPANAFMLGMLVRFPHLATRWSWAACTAGYVMADLLVGSALTKSLILNIGNLASVATGYLILSRFHPDDRRLTRPTSVLYMLIAVCAAAIVVGLNGTIADPFLFGGKAFDGFLYWSATEAVNYIAFLPMLLTLPQRLTSPWPADSRSIDRLLHALPLLAFFATIVAGAAIGGPGAVAFPVPALLWCAVTYRLFTTACLAFVFIAWTLLAIANGYLPVAEDLTSRATQLSIRFGASLAGLAPLVVASVMAAREALMQRLMFLSNHDPLTGLLNRSAFLDIGAETLARHGRHPKPVAVMMLDIDRFKSINDRYGHAAGDHVLIRFAQTLKAQLRQNDAIGRIGGEEFAALLDDCTPTDASRIATRVIDAFEADPIRLEGGETVTATVSIGLTTSRDGHPLDRLLAHADKALYRAKALGRNRMETGP